MKILEGRTVEQALQYFETGRTEYSHIVDPVMSEVYAKAFDYKKKIPEEEKHLYPIKEVCESLILGNI